jgi:two-component system sensor histidine kinase ChvG
VLENIFDNAIEVSPNGSKIIVELRSVQNRAELAVLDRGPGVPHGELTRIFERYVSLRSKPKPSEDGDDEASPHMGIGLWIVRRNLQAIGGSIRAENRPDGGLAMVMRFPLVA